MYAYMHSITIASVNSAVCHFELKNLILWDICHILPKHVLCEVEKSATFIFSVFYNIYIVLKQILIIRFIRFLDIKY